MMNEVIVNLNMLGTFMKNIIVKNLDDTSIVIVDWNYNRAIQLLDPEESNINKKLK